jgi:outer membrane protein OmpA-like peptidoglycan-associated protein
VLRAFAPLAIVGLVCVGCGLAENVDRGIDGVEHRLEQVLSAGAYYCAPRELALARAHIEFARVELAQGDPRSAENHLEEAELNARAAERLSPRERCAGSTPAPAITEIPRTEGPDDDLDGVEDANDTCPAEAEDVDGYLDADGCPDTDNDQDGHADSLDRCPNQPEDKDGSADNDGCPDLDSDADGVDDALDRCPRERGVAASEGCPRLKYKALDVTPKALRTTEPVLFEGSTDTIRSVSFPLLDTVVDALNEHPEIRLEIQGHTDSSGDDALNQNVSQTRAEAVLRYLTEHGIDPERLTAIGYGETRPIESNRTSQGREINRRIEFVRTDSAR